MATPWSTSGEALAFLAAYENQAYYQEAYIVELKRGNQRWVHFTSLDNISTAVEAAPRLDWSR